MTPEKPRLTSRHIWRIVIDLGANLVLPLLIYVLSHEAIGEVPALLASSMPPIALSLVDFIRDRRIDALSILVLVGIALSLLAFVGGGSVKALQLREKFGTLAFGLAFLGSAAIGKPIIFYLARASYARKGAAEGAKLDAARNLPHVRRMMTVMTVVWGAGLVAEFAVSLVLVYALPITQYLMIGPVVGYVTIAALAVWTYRYVRRTRDAQVAATPPPTPPAQPPQA